jgi:F-type H+-transporting ATPase subunit b
LKPLKVPTRFRVLVLGLVVLAAMAAGFAPAGVAQQAPAAQAAPADAQPNVQPGTSYSEEEKQNRAFLFDGPVVKWTAQKLGLPIETTAVLYEIVNFLIIALAIVVPLMRFLPKYLRGRKDKLAGDLARARKATEEANARLSAVEAKLSKLDEEIRKFRTEIEAEAEHDQARISRSLAEESKRIVEAAEQEIGVAGAQARRGLRGFAAGLAIDQAAKQLELTAEIDSALIAEFVGDVVGKGGKH